MAEPRPRPSRPRSVGRDPRRPAAGTDAAPAGDDPRRARRDRARRRLRRRRQVVSGLFLLGALVAAGYLVAWSPPARLDPGTLDTPAPTSAAPTTAAASPAEPTEPAPVLSLSGEFPGQGPGGFTYVDGEGDVLGDSGTLWRFRLAVEDNLDEDLAEFAAFVDETLGGTDGWTTDGQIRFQRVPGDAPYDITIHLATSGTTAQMCASGGLDVIAPGLPDGGVSCHYNGNVVLNLHRWRLSVPDYVDQEVPLEQYRRMVVNHEVGHALGYGHEACPGPGEPAPVMQQQTISLDGCEPYAWPYRDGVRYQGQPVP